jgi:hypothetical protein
MCIHQPQPSRALQQKLPYLGPQKRQVKKQLNDSHHHRFSPSQLYLERIKVEKIIIGKKRFKK